ncbi:hypothetical protein L9F63_009295, partial [Diploptera punctata]
TNVANPIKEKTKEPLENHHIDAKMHIFIYFAPLPFSFFALTSPGQTIEINRNDKYFLLSGFDGNDLNDAEN